MIRATVCLLLALPLVVWWRRRTQESVPLHLPDESWEEVQRDPYPDTFRETYVYPDTFREAYAYRLARGGLPRGDTSLKHRSVR